MNNKDIIPVGNIRSNAVLSVAKQLANYNDPDVRYLASGYEMLLEEREYIFRRLQDLIGSCR